MSNTPNDSPDLDRRALEGNNDLPVKRVFIPEWNGHVYLRTMTATERDAFEAIAVKGQGQGLRAAHAVRVLCDAQGRRLFKDNETELLAGKSWLALDRILDEDSDLNALQPAAVDDLEKNSGSGQADGSPSV